MATHAATRARYGRHDRGIALVRLIGLCSGLGLCAPGNLQAQSWVAALSELQASPGDLRDPRQPLTQRVALAHALGIFGPDSDAVPTLLEALKGKPEPALRAEILLALARRAAPEASAQLVAMLEHDDVPSPELGIALSAIATPEALAALTGALTRPKAAAIAERALLDAGPRAAIPLAHAVTSVLALRATRILGQLGLAAPGAASDAVPALTRALNSESPELRAAAAESLGSIGVGIRVAAVTGVAASTSTSTSTIADALLRALADTSPSVATAALRALALVATPAQAPALAAYYAHATTAQRPLALAALAGAEPEHASAQLAAASISHDSALRAAATQVLEGARPDPSFVPLLARVFDAELRESTASALARVPDGRGVPALLAAAQRSPDAAQRASRALAIALRRFRATLGSSALQQGQLVLRSLPPGERRLFLRALVRDADALDETMAALRAPNASMRATAADALGLLGDRDAAAALLAALSKERELEVKRSILQAVEALRIELPSSAMQRMLADPDTAPEAMQLCGASARPDAGATTLPIESRVLLRRVLASGTTLRARAAAALALARLSDQAARPALELTLGEASARLRLAAVRALAALGGQKVARALLMHARVERDGLVRRAALQAARHAGVPALLSESGELTLELRVRGGQSHAEQRPRLEVLLEDGRWLRLRALPGGELIVPDLPEGVAEVRAVD